MNTTKVRVTEDEVKRTAKKAAYSPLMETLTRLGYASRGLIYVMMGILALDVALGKSSSPANPQNAIEAIGRQPAGLVLLWLVLIGLVSYALWGVIRAVLDPLQKGDDLKGLIVRAGFLISAASYAFLILPTYGYISGAGKPGQGAASTQKLMASIMSTPLGHWLIVLAGAAVIAVGIYHIYSGFNASFDKQFSTYAMTAQEVRVAIQLGRFGTAARGVVFALVGYLLFQAGMQSNSSQPVSFDAALASLLHQPYGVYLLAVVAIGLVAFGIYSMLTAVWFRPKK